MTHGQHAHHNYDESGNSVIELNVSNYDLTVIIDNVCVLTDIYDNEHVTLIYTL